MLTNKCSTSKFIIDFVGWKTNRISHSIKKYLHRISVCHQYHISIACGKCTTERYFSTDQQESIVDKKYLGIQCRDASICGRYHSIITRTSCNGLRNSCSKYPTVGNPHCTKAFHFGTKRKLHQGLFHFFSFTQKIQTQEEDTKENTHTRTHRKFGMTH